MTGADPLADVLLYAAPFGIAAVFVMALFDRILPLLPSHGLFAAIGIAAAEGLWCLPTALIASVVGSGTGAFAAYRVGLGVVASQGGAIRLHRLVRRRDRVGRYLRRLRRSSAALPFVAQLMPAARLVVPLVAGTMRHRQRRFAIATLAGLTVWNLSFMAVGYAMARMGGATNVTWASMMFLALPACGFVAMRLAARRRVKRSR